MSGESPETATAETRKLAAIMFTDMVGFSRQMGADEATVACAVRTEKGGLRCRRAHKRTLLSLGTAEQVYESPLV